MNTSAFRRTWLLFLLLLPGLVSCSSGFDPQSYVPGLEIPTPLPETAAPPPDIPIEASILEQRVVCTGVPAGMVHVRLQAGEEHAVRGYLKEGEFVSITGRLKDLDQARWMELDRPVQGWINARYLCEPSQ